MHFYHLIFIFDTDSAGSRGNFSERSPKNDEIKALRLLQVTKNNRHYLPNYDLSRLDWFCDDFYGRRDWAADWLRDELTLPDAYVAERRNVLHLAVDIAGELT